MLSIRATDGSGSMEVAVIHDACKEREAGGTMRSPVGLWLSPSLPAQGGLPTFTRSECRHGLHSVAQTFRFLQDGHCLRTKQIRPLIKLKETAVD